MKKGFLPYEILCCIIGILQLFCTTQEGTLVGTRLENGVVTIVELSNLNARVFINQSEYTPLQNGRHSYTQTSGQPLSITLFYPGYGFADTMVTIAPSDTMTVQFMLMSTPAGSMTIHTDSGVSVLINNLPFAVTDSMITTLTGLPGGTANFVFVKGSSVAAESLIIVADSTISYTPVIGLTQRVLIEYISNVSCDGCPEKAAVLQEIVDSLDSPLIYKISFHASWPSRFDPIYIAAKEDQDGRVNYYKQWALPAFIVNGTPLIYNSASTEDLKTKLLDAITQAKAKAPQYSIAINSLSNDSGNVLIKAVHSPLNAVTLRIAAVQGIQEFTSPPGTNGETYFTNVFKGFYEGNAGISVTCSLGESTKVSFKFSLNEFPENDMWYYAWLQNDISQEIVQVSWEKR